MGRFPPLLMAYERLSRGLWAAVKISSHEGTKTRREEEEVFW